MDSARSDTTHRRYLTGTERAVKILIGGSFGVGKTTFLEEVGRMFVERGMFESGVYIMSGKEVEEKYQSDFEAYIMKNAETGNIFNLQSFNKYANSKFMLMIDDVVADVLPSVRGLVRDIVEACQI